MTAFFGQFTWDTFVRVDNFVKVLTFHTLSLGNRLVSVLVGKLTENFFHEVMDTSITLEHL